MRFLFVHNNFPAQFRHIAVHLAKDPKNEVAAIGLQTAQDVPGVRLQRYSVDLRHVPIPHPFARQFDMECRRGEQVLYAATALASTGFVPDVIVVHSGWGENLPLRAVFPRARIIVYCEFYYRANGQDVNFDPEFGSLSVDGATALNARNANGLLALIDADSGLSPTIWQRSTYPKILQNKIRVIHEGIDTNLVRPNADATFDLPTGRTLRKGDPVLTYVSRNLEPLRGFHVLMRALPRIMSACPEAQILIVGGNSVSYGPSPRSGTWKETFLKEQANALDLTRVHFLDTVPYGDYLRMLQVSAVHVYFTYPFVLSWSLMEAMSTSCTIVGSDTAPLQELLDDTSAYLVPFLDDHALADAAIACLRAPAAHVRLGQAARGVITEEFDLGRKILPRLTKFFTDGEDF